MTKKPATGISPAFYYLCTMICSTSICSACGASFESEVYQSINVQTNPELKQKVINGEIFMRRCPSCGNVQLAKYPLLYIDPSENLLLCLTDQELAVDGLEGYTARRVTGAGELIEKIKIFDAGLDDVIIELCKYVTCQELGTGANLKFLKMDGPDNDLIFTYPKNGDMEMISVGFNVYQDCGGVVQRNPELQQAAKGLATIDRNWLSQFIA